MSFPVGDRNPKMTGSFPLVIGFGLEFGVAVSCTYKWGIPVAFEEYRTVFPSDERSIEYMRGTLNKSDIETGIAFTEFAYDCYKVKSLCVCASCVKPAFNLHANRGISPKSTLEELDLSFFSRSFESEI